ncbi:NAD(P)/FAD-dependent oxidoreductase [Novisyntrophococcus fermenticellae]|uniref:NAD(P)/FAD-dependent oxidoreductase n=1 Tax=Novisyntrophococcus fermenticellae TaxID=2068655 RepID=UPI001E4AB8D1|nr:NAD(P)/FAD-dependent oxidoreductase [Novisyntrophococcus fermenticellae]
MKKYNELFNPIVLGTTQFRNRIFASPIGLVHFQDNLHPDEKLIAYYERKAQGGSATVSVGSAAADNGRSIIGPTLRLDDPTALAPHYRLSQCISRHGAIADIELIHAGANAYYAKLGFGNEIYGAFPSINGLGMEVPGMPEEVIFDTIEKFGDAAQMAKHCGYGMVTIHAGHGWLFNQFLGPENNRKDQWGGNMENRARFVNAIASNIKKKCGQGFPICIRISGSEMFEGGYDIDYGVEIAKQLDGHYDLINVSVGAHEVPSVFTITHPSMFLEDGTNVKYAEAVKKHMRYSKVAAVGAIAEPEMMEEIIASGKADVVYLCRQLIADPDTAYKAQMGKAKEIRKCIRCFECFSAEFTKKTTYCAINPEIGFEVETRYVDPIAKYKKKILVAGGGVGGMQAALTAAERGHEVILCEKTDILGGALRCELKVPFKQNTQKYLDGQAERIKDSNIDLRMNTKVTPELAKEINADVIIAALGAKPLIPKIPGIDGKNVFEADYAYMHAEKVGDNVIVLGGGLSGIELAIYLAGLGKKVSIMEMANSLNFSGNIIHSMAIKGEIERYNIQIITSTKATEINETGVIGEYAGNEFSPASLSKTIKEGMLESVITQIKDGNVEIGDKKLYKADSVIYAFGMIPLRDEANALRECAPLFLELGDCVEPKNIYAANSTAFTIARDIGRY